MHTYVPAWGPDHFWARDPMFDFLRRVITVREGGEMKYIVSYIVCAVVMGCLDFLWLTNMVGAVYRPAIGTLLAEKPNMTAAISFYLLYIVGIQIFAVRPALMGGDWTSATLYGALFGFFAFATYDLTNQATLKVWSLKVSLIDMAWGTFLTGVTATAGAYAAIKVIAYWK